MFFSVHWVQDAKNSWVKKVVQNSEFENKQEENSEITVNTFWQKKEFTSKR